MKQSIKSRNCITIKKRGTPKLTIASFLKRFTSKYWLAAITISNTEYTLIIPQMKDPYTGKYVELDFCQNLALRPKGPFFGKANYPSLYNCKTSLLLLLLPSKR